MLSAESGDALPPPDPRGMATGGLSGTGHAMEKNMEAGVLIDGGSIPSNLHKDLEALVTTNQLKQA